MDEPLTSRSVVKALLWPVYVPGSIYAIGFGANLSATVFIAEGTFGWSGSQIFQLMTWLGLATMLAALVAGTVLHRFGDVRSVAWASWAGCAVLVGAWAAVVFDAPAAVPIYVTALTLLCLTDAVWGIARQSLIMDSAGRRHRGRAMNLFGFTRRVGMFVGPALAGLLLRLNGEEAVHILLLVAGCLFLANAVMQMSTRRVTRLSATARTHGGAAGERVAVAPSGPVHMPGSAVRALFIVGTGMLTLVMVRGTVETFLPLWGVNTVGMHQSSVSFAIAAVGVLELALVIPAGKALDSVGRAVVVVTCLGVIGVGLIVMSLGTSPVWFLACMVVVGIGNGIGSGVNKTIGADLAPAEVRRVFLGRWEAFVGSGRVIAPALSAVVVGFASVTAGLVTMGVMGLVGAAWTAYWVPRFIAKPAGSGR